MKINDRGLVEGRRAVYEMETAPESCAECPVKILYSSSRLGDVYCCGLVHQAFNISLYSTSRNPACQLKIIRYLTSKTIDGVETLLTLPDDFLKESGLIKNFSVITMGYLQGLITQDEYDSIASRYSKKADLTLHELGYVTESEPELE